MRSFFVIAAVAIASNALSLSNTLGGLTKQVGGVVDTADKTVGGLVDNTVGNLGGVVGNLGSVVGGTLNDTLRSVDEVVSEVCRSFGLSGCIHRHNETLKAVDELVSTLDKILGGLPEADILLLKLDLALQLLPLEIKAALSVALQDAAATPAEASAILTKTLMEVIKPIIDLLVDAIAAI